MARVKLQTPPIFYGKPHEDTLDWIDRYETIGAYNGWRDADLRKFLIIHLDGPARNWYLCNADTIPDHWNKREGELIQGQRQQDQDGAREIFLKEFQKGTYALYQEQKLRNRMQDENECPLSYYYDVMNLCRVINPNMSERNKLDYLYQGLKRSLFTSIYTARPETCAKFLELLKLHTEAGDIARKKGVFVGVLSAEEKEGTSSLINTTIESLMKEIRDLKSQLSRIQHKNKTNEDELDEPFVCFGCGQPGHIMRFCPHETAPPPDKGKVGDSSSSGQGSTDQEDLE